MPKKTKKTKKTDYTATEASNGRRPLNTRFYKPKAKKPVFRRFLAVLVPLLIIVAAGFFLISKHDDSTKAIDSVVNETKKTVSSPAPKKTVATTPAVATAPAPATTACSSNTLPQLALVSISQRRFWACEGSNEVYTSSVITGMENLPADLTPTGTYYISSKQTNTWLDGSDSTGSWHDYVYYWMPFLHNQYGTYGFHDATWRDPSAFGNISPYSTDASHGCVEMPLATAKWLYGWINVGSTVTIES